LPSVPHSSQGIAQTAGQQLQQRMGGHISATPQITNQQRKLILESQKLINITVSDTDKFTQFLTDILTIEKCCIGTLWDRFRENSVSSGEKSFKRTGKGSRG
jgi:hypothetical protein